MKINKQALSHFFVNNGISDDGDLEPIVGDEKFENGAKAYTDSKAGNSSGAIPYSYTAEQVLKIIDDGRKRFK